MKLFVLGLKYFQLPIFLVVGKVLDSAELDSQRKALICGIIKNGESSFLQTKNEIEKIGSYFEDYRVIIYENNSSDSTKKLYGNWSKVDPHVLFYSQDLSPWAIENLPLKIEDKRIFFISRARNIVLDVINESRFDGFDFVIMMDLDAFEPADCQEIKNIIENPQQEWDAVFANGSYDLLALRSPEFFLSPELVGDNWGQSLKVIRSQLKKRLDEVDWLPVDSAFGGLAIYRKEALKKVRYGALLNKSILHRYHGYIEALQNDIKRNYLLKKLTKLVSLFENKQHLRYICEHVYLHDQMIQNGFHRFFIVKNLRRLSLQHEN